MTVGVLLAAGASSRMGSHKALARQDGASYTVHGIRRLWTVCTRVIAVLGSGGTRIQAEVEREFTRLIEQGKLRTDLAAAHRRGAKGFEVQFARNPRWRSGMLSSVQVGLREALGFRPTGILVLPVDHPSVSPESIRGLAGVLDLALSACRTTSERRRFAYAVVPRYRRRRGHPVALSPALARAIVSDRDALDLSDAMRRSARLIGYLDVDDSGVTRNVNRPRD